MAVWAIGQPDSTNGIYHQLAFTALNVLKGNLKPNGLITLSNPVPLAELPAAEKNGAAAKQSTAGLYGLLDGISAGKQPVEILCVYEANPLYGLPETKLFLNALAKVPMLVSFSSYMDETAAQADLILPNHTAFERYDDVKCIPGCFFILCRRRSNLEAFTGYEAHRRGAHDARVRYRRPGRRLDAVEEL